MRRIDAIIIAFCIFVAGGIIYLALQRLGLDSQISGILSQTVLICGLIGWSFTYILRAVNNKMTYNQQREDYEKAFFQQRLDELTPEELERIQTEIE
ncbi:hypothetical protein RINTHH_13980 [Richelia intracellularis HH01]|uniref:DUF3007 family protein n=1 Tax=Richelia intracellularis HH01 TaxID=1165094 RepID=M1X0K1_9NOST|nr:DUF3007 family protein [Richelia intracellularis]CCH67553.1 hypothetical protein RINTHH_13980 [Richelia intracellularis HH01]HAE05533.1 DUF3007 domain-containing protein [Richelia sp.]